MKKLSKLTVIITLIGSFLLLTAVVSIVAAVGYTNMKKINDSMASLYFGQTYSMAILSNADTKLYEMQSDIANAIIIPANRAGLESRVNTSMELINKEITDYRAVYLETEEVETLKKFDLNWSAYQKIIHEVVTDIKNGDIDKATTIISDPKNVTLFENSNDSLNVLIRINETRGRETNAQGDATFRDATVHLVIITLIGLLLIVGLLILIGVEILIINNASHSLT